MTAAALRSNFAANRSTAPASEKYLTKSSKIAVHVPIKRNSNS